MMSTFLFILVYLSVSSSPIVPQTDINALLDIYYNLDGKHWQCQWNITKIQNGDLSHDKCNYFDTFLKNISTPNGTITSEYVNKLHLIDPKMFGVFPAAIGNLTQLSYLFISAPAQIKGTIPEPLYNLKNLKSFDLEGMENIMGTISNSIGNLKELDTFIINSNSKNIITQLTGSIPATICHCKYLRIFILQLNHINGSLPQCFSDLTNILQISIDKTDIQGPLPSLCNNKKLQSFMLSKLTYLQSTIPSCNNTFDKLESVVINANAISSPLPQWIFCSKSLKQISISGNPNIKHDILPQCMKYSIALTDITLTQQGFIGLFPSLQNMTELVTLKIQNNKFEGKLSEIMPFQPTKGHLKLETLIIHENDFEEEDMSILLREYFYHCELGCSEIT
eukprot:438019_1